MKKLLSLILALSILLLSSAYAEVTLEDSHTWVTEDETSLVCTGENSYVEFNDYSTACTFKYGNGVIGSIWNSEYKQISGCGIETPINARLALCIYPDNYQEPMFDGRDPHIWLDSGDNQYKDCVNSEWVPSAVGKDVCQAKYSTTSEAGIWGMLFSNIDTACSTIDNARIVKCIFPDQAPEFSFTVSNINEEDIQTQNDQNDEQPVVLTGTDSVGPDAHVWKTEDNKYEVCSGTNSYIEFNNGNDACTAKYGNQVIESVCSSEYKQINGCGLSSKKAKKCSCISPSGWTKPWVTVADNFVWGNSDGSFMYCNGANQVTFNDGNSACATRYSRTSVWSICSSYKTNQNRGCGNLAETRVCSCIFPDNVEVPNKADFSVSDVTIAPVSNNETPSGPSSGSSGGSSGGSSRRSTTNDISKRTSLDVDIVNGVGRYLDLGNKGAFDFKGEKHSVYVKQIKEDSVILVFQSDPIEIELKIGETKQIDINTDGKSDLNVKLVNIYSGMAEVLVKEITEKVEVKTEIKEETKTEESKGMEGVTGATIRNFGIKNYAVGVTILLIAAIVVVLVMRVKRNNKTDEL